MDIAEKVAKQILREARFMHTHTHKLHQRHQSMRQAAAVSPSPSSLLAPPSALSQALKEAHAPKIEKNREKQSISICGSGNGKN